MKINTKCKVNVIGPVGSGKTTLFNSIIDSSTISYGGTSTYSLDSQDWVFSEYNFIVNVNFKEFNSIEDFQTKNKNDLTFEKQIFLILVGSFSENIIPQRDYQYWISEINQSFPNSIVLLIYHKNKTSNSLKFDQLRVRFPIVRDIFDVFNYQFPEILPLVHYFRNLILNEFTNRLEFVREKIRNNLLHRIPVLDLGSCYLTNLYEVPLLFECTHLIELILSNEWAQFSDGKWRQIKSENTGGNNCFRYVPPPLYRLTKLKTLIIGGDWNFDNKEKKFWSITDINWIKNLHDLEFLNASNNSILKLPELNRLKKLRVLHLNNNQISKIPNLSKLTRLEELYLSNNLLKDVSFLNGLKEIKTIDLHSNKITDITPLKSLIERLNISNSKWKKNTINVAINPLEQPPIEVIITGKPAVLSYFRDINIGKPFINDEIKLILVGNSEVGKTTLAKYLDNEKNLDEVHLATLWMEEKKILSKKRINKLGKKCIINLFDFGGHDYYHDTHHLFFGTNCIYIILWDKQTNQLNLRATYQNIEGKDIMVQTQDYPLKYWLDSVKHFTKVVESENFDFETDKKQEFNSFALVIQNKVNGFQDIFHLNNQQFKSAYPFIFNFLNISIINQRRNLDFFDNSITDMIEQGSLIGAKLPGYYGVIKEAIVGYSGKPILTIVEFREYCNSNLSLTIDSDQARYLAYYLKQLGIILFYPKGLDDDKVFIKKEWVIKNIYTLFEKLPEKKGEFNYNYILDILRPKLTAEEVSSFIELLIEFKVIFKHPLLDLFIAPLYLSNSPSNTVRLFLDDNKVSYRRFVYNGFIHKNITLSLFQEYGKLVLTENREGDNNFFYYWKNGLIIKDTSTGELVLIQFFIGNNEGNAFIDIVKLNKPLNTTFTDEIIAFIKKINQDYEVEEMVSLDGKIFIGLKILNDNAKNGKHIFTETCKRDLEEARPNKIYHNLKDYTMFLEDGIRKKRVVISYSKKDLTRVHTFIRYLKPLVDLDLIEQPWYCTLANPGDVWDEKIHAKFKEADIVFFMVSEYFYSTSYIVEKEIKTVIDRYDFDKSVKVVPIILEHYDWERKPPYNLKRFSAMPFQAKPISDFNNEKLAWNTITAAVRKMIEKDLDPAEADVIAREMQEFYERQVEGKLDRNS